MVKVTMVSYQFRPSILKAVKKVNAETNGALEFKYYNTYDVDNKAVNLDEFVNDLRSSEIVLLDVRGGDTVSKIVCNELKETKNIVVVLVGGSSDIINLTRLGSFSISRFSKMKEKPIIGRLFKKSKMTYEKIVKMRDRFEKIGSKLPIGVFKHARNYSLLLKYYETPCFENYYGMFLLLLKEYGGVKVKQDIPKPKLLPPMGIQNFETGEIYEDLNTFLNQYKFKEKPLIGVLFYGGYHYDQSYPAAKLLTEKIERYGYGVIPVFCSDLRYYLAVEKFFFKDNKPIIDVLVDLLWFRLAGGPIGGDHTLTANILSKLNAPILHGVHLSSKTVKEWRDSKQGIPPIETVTSVILPELDGRNEPIVTHGVQEKVVNDDKLEEYVAIEDRVEKLARRAVKWLKLKRKENREKRIALIIYNYPPGEENIGKVAYLNVFGSVSRLLKAMKKRGYNVSYTPSAEEIKDLLLSNGVVNSGEWTLTPENAEKLPKVNLNEYSAWLKNMPSSSTEKIVNEWGKPPGQIMTYQDALLVPGLILGNIFIGVQPSRGVHEDPSKIYHDKELPPHHQYVGFYKWIKSKFKADAVIHLGTHGTLEFLPGKEVGLSEECFPDILIDDLPNIYVYHAVNSSESSIAKRRSYALIVNHASPPVTVSELHGDLMNIERLISQYFDVSQYDREKAGEVAEKIMREAEKYGLGESVEEIYDKLQEYKATLIPKGLHVLGEELSSSEVAEYLTFLTRYDRSEVKSLHRILMENKGLNYDEALEFPHKKCASGETYGEVLTKINEDVREIIEKHVINDSREKLPVKSKEMERTLNFLREIYMRTQSSDEINAVLNALEGKFIPPGPGGDFIRTPEIFPTGRNMYQLDPTNIPTEIAAERGRKIAEEYLKQFYKVHGRYPKVVSVVLWAFETMKTGGETIAAIFHLLGVKPVWKSIYIRDLEIIPLSQLNRPRIDVVVTICGIFRDTFYNIVELLDKAVREVANLDEPLEMNYVKANVSNMRSRYGSAAELRIFGPPEGQYATSLTSLIESSAWKSELELVNAYLESMKFAYGEKERNVNAKHILNSLLPNVEIVAQVRDTVEYEITDLDHYYEFLGGLTKTVENIKGNRPLVLVADTTREKLKVEKVEEAVKRGVVTRIINPKWLNAMIKSGYNGAAKIADRVEYMLGLAATVGGVENWMWNSVAERIVFSDIGEKIKENNPWAFRKLVSRLIEAGKRGYWRLDEDMLKKLEDEYLKTESLLEEHV
ncbi:MAG: magnesium chelatase subunit H [Candidatus Odinarchaeia archaeon]